MAFTRVTMTARDHFVSVILDNLINNEDYDSLRMGQSHIDNVMIQYSELLIMSY